MAIDNRGNIIRSAPNRTNTGECGILPVQLAMFPEQQPNRMHRHHGRTQPTAQHRLSIRLAIINSPHTDWLLGMAEEMASAIASGILVLRYRGTLQPNSLELAFSGIAALGCTWLRFGRTIALMLNQRNRPLPPSRSLAN